MTSIEMPQLAAGDDEGQGATLASWLVSVGDRVERGEVIAELETDKATVELESPTEGVVSVLHVAAGTEGIQPGVVLGEIAEEAGAGDAAPSPDTAQASGAPAAEGTPPVVADVLPTAAVDAPAASDAPDAGDVVKTAGRRSTPLARRAAVANAVDLERVEGSGPGGRVVEADVLRVVDGGEGIPSAADGEKPPAPRGTPVASESAPGAEVEGVPVRVERLSAMRKTIARRMTESKQQVPHFYLRARVAIDEVMAIRARLNAALADEGRDVKLSVNDFVVRAVALAMRDVPAANVQYAEDGMRVFEQVDVSVAVATEGGLVTPIVRQADRKGLIDLSLEIKALAEQARAGSLRPEQYQGGTVTVSNLGMYGIETVYPILNLPQACIVGVGAAEEQPVVRDGEFGIARITGVTLAADHRAVDGAVGAQLLAAIRGHLEDPMGMML